MDYNRNLKFFKPKMLWRWPIGLIVIGILTLSMGVGIFLIAAGIIWIVVSKKGTPTEAEIDAQAAELVVGIESYALKKMSLEEGELVATTITFWGYDLGRPILTDPVVGKEGLQDKKGSDDKWRSPHVAINVILFTENEIHSMRRFISLVSDAKIDKKDEFAYKHVAGISSDTEQFEYTDEKTGKKENRQRNIVILRSGGERFPFNAIDIATAENAEKALKTMWRQKNA